MYNIELIEEFIDHYDDDMSHHGGAIYMSYLDFIESRKYGILTEDDGLANYLVDGEDSNINALNNPIPARCGGIVWYNK